MQSKVDDELRHTLEGQVQKLSEDVLSLQQRAQVAEASQQEMAEEHERAMRDMQQATSEGRKACAELADAQAAASKAGADCVRAQQVWGRFLARGNLPRASWVGCAVLPSVRLSATRLPHPHANGAQAMAKLSADNVVLMVRLQKTEARCKTLDGECAELRAAVETQSGPWFDDIRAVVQRRMQEGMQEARALQAELERAKEGHAGELARVTEAKAQLGAHLSSTLASCQQLEAELQQSQCGPGRVRACVSFRTLAVKLG